MSNLTLKPSDKLLRFAYFFLGMLSSIPASTLISWVLATVSGASDFEGARGYAMIGLFPFVYLAMVLVLVFKFSVVKTAPSKMKYAVVGFGLISLSLVAYLAWAFSKYS